MFQGLEPRQAAGQRDRWRGLLERLSDPVFGLDRGGRVRWCNDAASRLLTFDGSHVLGQAIWNVLELQTRTGQDLDAATFRIVGPGALLADENLLLNHPVDGWSPVRLTVLAGTVELAEVDALAVVHAGWGEPPAPVDGGDWVSTVSHEMRSPITSILGLTGLMLQRPIDAVKARQYLDVVHQDALRLSALVDDLMDYERLCSRRNAYRLMPVAWADVVARLAGTFESHAVKHPIAVELPDDLPPVLGDADALTRVLDNLVTNAAKYSPDGAAINIRAHATGRDVTLAVRDPGAGFDPALAAQLFEKFFRLPGQVRGSGLGLAIVKEIVQGLGGRVWAHSDGPGQGSTFGVVLAVAVDRPAPPETEE